MKTKTEDRTHICPYCDGAGWTINDRFSSDTKCYDCDSTGKVTQEVWQKYYDWVKCKHDEAREYKRNNPQKESFGIPITEWLKFPR